MAGTHHTSFLPGLPPSQALQLAAIATGPKQPKKSLSQPHAECHGSGQPEAKESRGPGRSEKLRKEEAPSGQRGRTLLGRERAASLPQTQASVLRATRTTGHKPADPAHP